jgi:monoamine oxidase
LLLNGRGTTDRATKPRRGAELERVSVRDLGWANSGVNWRVVEGRCVIVPGASPRHRNPAVGGGPAALKPARAGFDRRRRRDRHPALLAEQKSPSRRAPTAKGAAACGLANCSCRSRRQVKGRLFGRTDRSGTATYHLRPFGRPQIEVYFAATLAAELEAAGEAAFLDFAVAELVGLLGSDFARRIRPLHLHRWGIDPLSRGSYSYALPGKADCRAMLAAPVDDRLFFAGEACSTNDYSTAHGAYLTGVVAADQAIAARRGRRRR